MSFFDFRPIEDSEYSSSYLIIALSGQSYKIKMSDLAKQIATDFAAQLGSMAFNDTSAYALSCHDHDIYTSAIWYQNKQGAQGTLLKMSTQQYDSHLNISHHNYAISATCSSDADIENITKQLEKISPKLGELRFFTDRAMPRYNAQDKFIGWVPCDGTQYQLSDFVLSTDIIYKNIFQHNYANGTFNVPTISDFMKFSVDLTQKTTTMNAHVVVPPHTHDGVKNLPRLTINTTRINKTSSPVQTYRSGAISGDNLHVGSKNHIKSTQISSVSKINTSFALNTVYTSIGDASDYHPAYVSMPVYVYVGRSRFSPSIVI